MSKSKKTAPKAAKSAATKPVQRWSIGVFVSAKSGELIVTYVRKDGSVAPMYAKSVKTKKALFHSAYKGITYAEAREQLMKDAAKAGVKPPTTEEEKKENPKQVRRAA